MAKIVAQMFVKKENQGKFIEIAKDLIVESNKEPECISYELTKNTEEESLVFVENWKTMDYAKNVHMNTEHFKEAVPKLLELCFKDPEFLYLEEV